jgi:AcrR family transcriptional regulator
LRQSKRYVAFHDWNDTEGIVRIQVRAVDFWSSKGPTVRHETVGQRRGEQVRQLILETTIDLVFEAGFRSVCVESIAARSGVAKTTIYRRWPNKAAVVMDAFMMRVGSGTLFPTARKVTDRIRLQMHAMAKVFMGKDGALVRGLLAEAQFDPELAAAFRDRWTLPRRAMAVAVFRQAIEQGELRREIDPETAIDLLYAPLYYRLQMGTGDLSEDYIEGLFEHGMKGLRKK